MGVIAGNPGSKESFGFRIALSESSFAGFLNPPALREEIPYHFQ